MKSNRFIAVLAALTVWASLIEAQASNEDISLFMEERSKCACLTDDEANNQATAARCGYSSCQQIKKFQPLSRSGYYDLLVSGENVRVYCRMETLCGVDGGWTRMAYLDMSDSSENCPSDFKLYEENGVRACGRQTGGCQSAIFPSKGVSYTQVCGKVIGYQFASPDAFRGNYQDIDSAYVDGISITRGSEPRQHIWTLAAGLQETFPTPHEYQCPCVAESPFNPRSFMGNDFFCESGQPGTWNYEFLTDDPLWDGIDCRGTVEEACCESESLPWFHKTIHQPTRDDIELRVCSDEAPANEDIPVALYEIYVQ